MEDPKIKIIRPTPPEYSRLMYPCLPIHGVWFERFGFKIGQTVRVTNPKKGRLIATNLAVARPSHNTDEDKFNLKTVSASPYGHAQLMLRGLWFFRYGFAVGHEVKIINSRWGVAEVVVIRTVDQVTAAREELIRLGTAEWKEFDTMLRTAI